MATEIVVEVFGNAEDEPAKTLRLLYEVDGNAEPTGTAALGTIANDDAACTAPFNKEPNPWRVFGADPLSYAHLGGVIDFPENTLYAYAEVALVGADVLVRARSRHPSRPPGRGRRVPRYCHRRPVTARKTSGFQRWSKPCSVSPASG